MTNKIEFITKDLVDKAKIVIDSIGVPQNREGTKFHVLIENKSYPFKLLITEAAKIDGVKLTSADFQSNKVYRDYFTKITTYSCVDKKNIMNKKSNKSFKEIIKEFKLFIAKDSSVLSERDEINCIFI